MASIAALDFLYDTDMGESVETVYTFGSPRVGNKEWADVYKALVDSKKNLKNKGRIVHL